MSPTGAPSQGTPPQRLGAPRIAWPIARSQIKRVGDAVTADRDGKGRPHKGIDLFAEAGTEVLAVQAGRVLRVMDGRRGQTSGLQRAGLFIDVQGSQGLIFRFLHLGTAAVQNGDAVTQGAVLGTVAPPFTSGLAETPHLHFEVRQHDYQKTRKDYGPALDPRRLLPSLRS
jgi:murein DD-endopeptidase MepM/ murein hydrolase activator NlpD